MKNNNKRGLSVYILVILLLLGSYIMYRSSNAPESITYQELVQVFESAQVEQYVLQGSDITLKLKSGDIVEHSLASIDIFMYDLGQTISIQRSAGIIQASDYKVSTNSTLIYSLMPTILLTFVVIFGIYFISKKQDGGKGGMGFGRSRAKLISKDDIKVTFDDVAGADEEKSELLEIVDFLKNPQKYMELGARIPKGLLLVGPPGTGKTLLAKAVAGESDAPFLTISGSDFIELYVGVGASRVRDLFEQAKKVQPAIIFIDEIDAVGRQRGTDSGGSNDERDRTLNQLLVEMDGFAVNQGVIVIAATNRADVLDPALLRPGRFDRQVYVGTPDLNGREAILKVHAKNKTLDETVSLKDVARSTVGFSGADLENLLNEAALLSARRGKKTIKQDEISESFLKVIMGTEKRNRMLNEHEKKLTAYHEAGHAVVSKLLPTQDPVHQVSIIPRGSAGGFTLNLPLEDKMYSSKLRMEEDLVCLLAGRVAEKLILDDISTGAHNDIERATNISRAMVVSYGMSEKLGPINYESDPNGALFNKVKISNETAKSIDTEVHAIISTAYSKCEDLLRENMSKLVHVAEFLLRNEVIDGEVFEKLFNLEEIEDLPKTEFVYSKIEKTETDSSEKIKNLDSNPFSNEPKSVQSNPDITDKE